MTAKEKQLLEIYTNIEQGLQQKNFLFIRKAFEQLKLYLKDGQNIT